MKPLGLTGDIETTAEVFSESAQRLIRYGCTGREAYALSRVIKLDRDTPDGVVEDAVITALVIVKEAVSGVPEVEYLGGIRRDTLRLEGR